MALRGLLCVLLLAGSASAFYNYTTQDLNGTSLNQTGEYVAYRGGDWLWGAWLFWTNALPAPFAYLPVSIVVVLVGFIGYIKTRSIVVPAVWFMFLSTVIGISMWAAIAPYVGFIAFGVVLLAIIVAALKIYYG